MKYRIYNTARYEKQDNLTVGDISEEVQDAVQWFIIDINNTEELEEACRFWDIHHLVTEDIQNRRHLPKYEISDDSLFITVKFLTMDEQRTAHTNHVSVILRRNQVLTFIDGEAYFIKMIEERLHQPHLHIRHRGADYLLYVIMDLIVDRYLEAMEDYREQIDELEEAIMVDVDSAQMQTIRYLKREISELRKYISPLRDEMLRLRKDPDSGIREETMPFFLDIQDHLNHVVAQFDTFREMLKDLVDLYLGTLSMNMNSVMKTLTVVATIFIPLTFIVGIYGMNFRWMPELSWQWGYPMILGIMLLLTAGMLMYIKRKNWF